MATSGGIIDINCNLFTPEVVASRPAWTSAFHKEKNKGDLAATQGGLSIRQQLDLMDEAGIERALLIAPKIGRRGLPGSWEMDASLVIDAVQAHPDRFSGLAGVNPYDGIAGIKELERLVTEYGFVGAHLYPHWFEMAPDAAPYYPFYAKCGELDVPIQVQIGYCRIYTPEQQLPSVGQPVCLDRVACHLPEVKIVGIHLGWPWTDEMLSVADKHANVHVAGDRHAPSRWGESFIDYAGTWGQDKVMFGTDWPVVPFDVGARELGELGFDEDAYRKVSRDNARALYQLP